METMNDFTNTLSKEQRKEITTIIVNQMGGYNRLSMMLGAFNFVSGMNGELSFKFRMFNKANYCKVELTPKDTYTMTFGKITKFDYKVVETFEDVYCDELISTFESFTGLRTKLF